MRIDRCMGGRRLALAGRLTIEHVAASKHVLMDALDRGVTELDLAAVEALDAAGLQLLLLAKREAEAAGRTLHLVEHSIAVVELFELYGAAGMFGDPLILPPRSEETAA